MSNVFLKTFFARFCEVVEVCCKAKNLGRYAFAFCRKQAHTPRSSRPLGGFLYVSQTSLPPLQKAFTLLEVIIVVALVAFVYTVAIPNIGMQTSTEVATSLGQINSDIRAAFDMSVLSNKPHRLVFRLATNEYWLESSESSVFYLGDNKLVAEPSKEEIEEKKVLFETEMQKYEELAGESYVDPDGDKKVPAESPVVAAKDRLQGPIWSEVENIEWKKRVISENLIIKDIQAEHLEKLISVEENGEEATAYIYFLPRGYVERAVIHIYYRLNDREFDTTKAPYTIVTKSFQGEAQILDGFHEINVHEVKEGDEEETGED